MTMQGFSDKHSFVGTAGYTSDGKLIIGEGERVVKVDMDPALFAVPGNRRTTGIGVYGRGDLSSSAEAVISHVAQPSSLELEDRRANEDRRRVWFPTDPPLPPGEFLGVACFGEHWRLRIGAGQHVVELEMGGAHWIGMDAPDGINVYLRRGGALGFDELVLSYSTAISASEWREIQEEERRFWGERLGRIREAERTGGSRGR